MSDGVDGLNSDVDFQKGRVGSVMRFGTLGDEGLSAFFVTEFAVFVSSSFTLFTMRTTSEVDSSTLASDVNTASFSMVSNTTLKNTCISATLKECAVLAFFQNSFFTVLITFASCLCNIITVCFSDDFSVPIFGWGEKFSGDIFLILLVLDDEDNCKEIQFSSLLGIGCCISCFVTFLGKQFNAPFVVLAMKFCTALAFTIDTFFSQCLDSAFESATNPAFS